MFTHALLGHLGTQRNKTMAKEMIRRPCPHLEDGRGAKSARCSTWLPDALAARTNNATVSYAQSLVMSGIEAKPAILPDLSYAETYQNVGELVARFGP